MQFPLITRQGRVLDRELRIAYTVRVYFFPTNKYVQWWWMRWRLQLLVLHPKKRLVLRQAQHDNGTLFHR